MTKLTLLIGLLIGLTACDKTADSFSLLPESNTYTQSSSYAPRKIDILWVVDNSGSMATSQNNLATNFSSFINRFQENNYDFHMAVASTDAWEKKFNSNSTKSRIRDGGLVSISPTNVTTHSGVFVMDPTTVGLTSTFITNITLGVYGNGDERAFESIRQTLNDTWNSSFRRTDAFLSVIIVSDEDDFSHSTNSLNESYNNAGLSPVSDYVTYLDTLTNSKPGSAKNYSVNAIAIWDNTCRATLTANDSFGGRKIATRYGQLADATSGIKASLCSNFGTSLQIITDSILELSNTFKLNRVPVESTIRILVNGASVSQSSSNGWTYDSTTNSIVFHGAAVPPADASIVINFDPATVKE
ncbi:MAG: hypothetical protein ACOYOK_07235 [Pseudobdellovibrionaceae bacterium]